MSRQQTPPFSAIYTLRFLPSKPPPPPSHFTLCRLPARATPKPPLPFPHLIPTASSPISLMATAAATRPSGPVLPIPNFGSASPSRIKLAAARSPAKSVSYSSPPASPVASKNRRSCMCSPTNHPGSFRCSLHKEQKPAPAPGGHGHGQGKPDSPPPPPPPVVVSTGSGARDGVGSRVLARRALARSRQSPQRRFSTAGGSFRPRPSRLSAGSFSRERAGDNRQ
uniref:Uncharacterized protein n=1 Tax=Avena sativa TaxID=4498 RepID=A0ACD5ZBZ5_AVESA